MGRLVDVLGHPPAWMAANWPDRGRTSGPLTTRIDAVIAEWTVEPRPSQAPPGCCRPRASPPVRSSTRPTPFRIPTSTSGGFSSCSSTARRGSHFHPGANFHMSRTPPGSGGPHPTLGQDNEYVYKDILGVTDEEYADLIASGQAGTEYL